MKNDSAEPSIASRLRFPWLLSLCLLAAPYPAPGQDKASAKAEPPAQAQRPPGDERARLIAAAREIMGAQTYCALITLDESGRPQVRTMNPFPPEADMTVWFATNTRSRKVREMRRDPRVTLYYSDHKNAIGYVALAGRAVLIEDMEEILKRKRAYWDQAFPGLKNLVLIKVVPERLDVLNYRAGVQADPETWRTPSIELGAGPTAAPRP
jgi:general stress protein 26